MTCFVARNYHPPTIVATFPPKRTYTITSTGLWSKTGFLNMTRLLCLWKLASGRRNIHRTFFTFTLTQQDRVTRGESDIAVPDDCGNIKDDDYYEEEVKLTSNSCKQPLLFLHQTTWQRRLLKKYGDNICLLDATYRTTRYSLPLFFLAVKTNVDYQVVGSFIIQYETTEAIAEALQTLKQWNKSWKPEFFMTDLSEQEINAVEEIFPGL